MAAESDKAACKLWRQVNHNLELDIGSMNKKRASRKSCPLHDASNRFED